MNQYDDEYGGCMFCDKQRDCIQNGKPTDCPVEELNAAWAELKRVMIAAIEPLAAKIDAFIEKLQK